jgi:hygromycin-B 4-O-kinase
MASSEQPPPGAPGRWPAAITAADVEAFLTARFGRAVDAVAPIGRGEWSRAFAYRRGGGDYVVRFGALDEDYRKDQFATRFRSARLPIPAVIEVGATAGGYYAISERAFGDDLDALDGPRLRAALPSLFRALDAIRLADVSAGTGYGQWGADGAAPAATWRAALLDQLTDRPGDRTHGWRARLVTEPARAARFDAALDAFLPLAEHVPDVRHLIHSDLLNANVLVAGDRISAVLDWGCAMYGDFLYDLAWLNFWSAWYRAWEGIDFRAEALRHYRAIGLDVPDFERRLRCYEAHIGLTGQAYQAFTGRWDEFDWTEARVRACLG